jgi:hypothetical protein
MGRDQGLEHFGEAFGGPTRPQALTGDAGTFDQQEQFICEQLGVAQPGLATKLDDQFAVPALELFDHPPCRVIGIRQFDRRIREGAAALARAEFEFGNEAQPGKQLLLGLAGMGPFDRGPRDLQLPAVFAQALCNQLIL